MAPTGLRAKAPDASNQSVLLADGWLGLVRLFAKIRGEQARQIRVRLPNVETDQAGASMTPTLTDQLPLDGGGGSA